MAFAASVSVYDIGPIDLVTGQVAEEKGNLIAANADVAIEVHVEGWMGTFLTPLQLQLGGIYWIETAEKKTSQITVTTATASENTFDGLGVSPFSDY